MGSIVARPKKPKTVTPKSSASTTTTTTSGTSGTTSGASSSSSATETTDPVKARVETVLRRNRGVLGNFLTGFRGVLDSQPIRPQRKTLLGE